MEKKNYTTKFKGERITLKKNFRNYPDCKWIKLAGEIFDETGYVKSYVDEDGNEYPAIEYYIEDIEEKLDIQEYRVVGFTIQDLVDFCIKNGKDLNNTYLSFTDVEYGGICNCTTLRTNEEVNIVELA